MRAGAGLWVLDWRGLAASYWVLPVADPARHRGLSRREIRVFNTKEALLLLDRFATVFVFLVLAVGFGVVTLALSSVLRPRRPTPEKLRAYECGEEPEGSPWIRFNVRFYLVALFFIVFDVEVVFLLPWAVVFKELLAALGSFIFWEMALFIAILVVGLAYVWAKGDLAWIKSLPPRDEDDLESLSWYTSGRYGSGKRGGRISAKPGEV
jgi:NADH-quinone oxidoreductase subunit A